MSKVRARRKQSADVFQFQSYKEEFIAIQKGPEQRKQFHVNDLKLIKPRTEKQSEMFHAWFNGQNIMATGCAGSGKTFSAVFLALREILDPKSPYEKLIIVRSAVQTRDLGFLPGTLEEKLQAFEDPYVGIFDQLFPWKKSYDNLKKLGKVEFHSTSFLRGVTFEDAIVIVDECQSATMHELSSIITRLGDNCRIFFCGDEKQTDALKRGETSGLADFKRILANMDEFSEIEFGIEDIVRSGLVRSFIKQSYLLGY